MAGNLRAPAVHWAAKLQKGNKAKGLADGFRSGLEEENAKHLERLGVPALFETTKLRYVIPQTFHMYTPDFLLPNGIIVETKGRFLGPDRNKHLLVQAQYPDLDIRFVVYSKSTKIGPGAKTTVIEWLDKNGYKWALKLIPEAWTKEPGPSRDPKEVIAGGPRYGSSDGLGATST